MDTDRCSHPSDTFLTRTSRRAALGRLAASGLAAVLPIGMGSNRARAQAANAFWLEGAGTRIRYSTTSFAGPPTFDYRGPFGERRFLGDAIRVEESATLGQLVSVLLDAEPDARVVWLTVLLPRYPPVQREDDPNVFDTLAVLTTHLTTEGGPRPIEGALQSYEVVELTGTAGFLMY